MPAYQWDVFLSMSEAFPFVDWVDEHFWKLFKGYMDQEIQGHFGRDCEIYFYKNKIEAGQTWPDELCEAIMSARVAVALCSPSYFTSPWCVREFETFRMRSSTTKKDLLVPISIHDGEHFPAHVTSKIQIPPLGPYVKLGKGFTLTAAYSDFQDTVQALCKLVGKRVKDAPQFEVWPIAPEQDPDDEPPIPQVTF